jgi:uncharacterized membrane protein
MHVLGPIALYLAIVAVSAIAIMPLCRRAVGAAERVPLIALSLTAGPPVALLVFSLVARLLGSYAIAVPVTLFVLGAAAWFVRTRSPAGGARPGRGPAGWDLRADLVLHTVYAVVFLALYALRTRWPSLYWDNDYAHVGTEKLFNFSLMQAFVHGRGYPPENLWLAGQPIDYYVLLHSLPGLAAWGWRVLTGDGAAGSTLFVFSDVFLLLLGSFAISAWTQALLTAGDPRLGRRAALAVSVGLGLGVFLSTSGLAVWRVFDALTGGPEAPWWSLEREAVAYTYSQYPFYLLLQGDHQAFQRVFFLQVALYGAMVLLLQARRFDGARVALAAALAAAVCLSHSGSALLDLAVLGSACAVIVVMKMWQREWPRSRVLLANLGATGAVTLALALPALWHHQSPEIDWYWVDTRLASPLGAFLSAQAGPLAFFLATLGAGLVALRTRSLARFWPVGRRAAMAAAALIALLAATRGGVAVAVACAFCTLAFAPRRSEDGEDRTVPVVLGAAAFVVWLMPEILVGDFAHRGGGDWKRWNLAMRFWLEGYYLVPFLAVIAFGPALRTALEDRLYRRSLAVTAIVLAATWATVNAYSVADRRVRTPNVPGFDGAAFFVRDFPCDATIAAELGRIPTPVRVAELCGTGEIVAGVPIAYGWAGRIAAFSARPGICGWSEHVSQFSPRFHGDSPTGPWTWDRFREYERHMQQAYTAAQDGEEAPESRAFLDALGVTHVVVGDQESRKFPGLTGRDLAHALRGRVSFERGDGCAVVSLARPAATTP